MELLKLVIDSVRDMLPGLGGVTVLPFQSFAYRKNPGCTELIGTAPEGSNVFSVCRMINTDFKKARSFFL